MNEAVETLGTPNRSTLGQPSHRKWKQRIKDNPCTQGSGGKLSSKAARSGKASRIGHDGFKLKIGLPRDSPWFGADRETSSFSYWYKIAEENCIMPVQSSAWSVVRDTVTTSQRHQGGSRGNREMRTGSARWCGPQATMIFCFFSCTSTRMYITPANRSRIQGWNERVKAGWNN